MKPNRYVATPLIQMLRGIRGFTETSPDDHDPNLATLSLEDCLAYMTFERETVPLYTFPESIIPDVQYDEVLHYRLDCPETHPTYPGYQHASSIYYKRLDLERHLDAEAILTRLKSTYLNNTELFIRPNLTYRSKQSWWYTDSHDDWVNKFARQVVDNDYLTGAGSIGDEGYATLSYKHLGDVTLSGTKFIGYELKVQFKPGTGWDLIYKTSKDYFTLYCAR